MTTERAAIVGAIGEVFRAAVTAHGSVEPFTSDVPPLRWSIVAEDRTHDPSQEPDIRQRALGGAPVVETRMRVPGGDVVQRVYAVAELRGMVVVEIENESPAAVAVVFSHAQLRTERPLPATGAVPLGHRTIIRVGLAPDGSTGPMPPSAAALGVVRGWAQHVERASRLVLPDERWTDAVMGARCELALAGPEDVDTDAVAALLGICELVRLGEDAGDWVAQAVTAAERIARSARTCGLGWDGDEALAAVERLLLHAHDPRAAADAAIMRQRLGGSGAPRPSDVPAGVRAVPFVETQLARPEEDGRCTLLPSGHPWLGANWEAHHLPAGPHSRVSLAVRWHGERPALLWDVEGEPLVLVGGAAAPGWHSGDARGEALWPAPPQSSSDNVTIS